jgi:hypothetical protein
MADAAFHAQERGRQLFDTADGQLAELIGLLSAGGEEAFSRPCPGREKMGNGTVAACATQTTDHYRRIAEFLLTAGQTTRASTAAVEDGHRMQRFLRARGHGPGDHAESAREHGAHDDRETTQNLDLGGLLERLTVCRNALAVLAELSDAQLDSVPPTGSFRFCDGQRSLEQVVAALLKHQGHQIDAMRAAVA